MTLTDPMGEIHGVEAVVSMERDGGGMAREIRKMAGDQRDAFQPGLHLVIQVDGRRVLIARLRNPDDAGLDSPRRRPPRST